MAYYPVAYPCPYPWQTPVVQQPPLPGVGYPVMQPQVAPVVPSWPAGQPGYVVAAAPQPMVTPQSVLGNPYPVSNWGQAVPGMSLVCDGIQRPVQTSSPAAGVQWPQPGVFQHPLATNVAHVGQLGEELPAVPSCDELVVPDPPTPSESASIPTESKKRRRRSRKAQKTSPEHSELTVTIQGASGERKVDVSTDLSEIAPADKKVRVPAGTEPDKVGGDKSCPIVGCTTTEVKQLKRHFMMSHCPWFVQPATACWSCGLQFFRLGRLKDHLQDLHAGVTVEENWGPSQFPRYAERMRALILLVGGLRGLKDLFVIYRFLKYTKVFMEPNQQPDYDKGLWDFWCRSIGGNVPEGSAHSLYEFNSPACLLHWRTLLFLMTPLQCAKDLEQIKQVGANASFDAPVGGSRPTAPALGATAPVTSSLPTASTSTGRRSALAASPPGVAAAQPQAGTSNGQAMETDSTTAQHCFPPGVAGGRSLRVLPPRQLGTEAPGMPVRVIPDVTGVMPKSYKDVDVVVTNGAYLTDAHCHLYLLARQAQKPYLLNPLQRLKGVPGRQNPQSTPRVLLGYAVECFMVDQRDWTPSFDTLMAAHPAAKLTVGVHPKDVMNLDPDVTGKMADRALKLCRNQSGVVGIGEFGLDYFHAKHPRQRERQKQFLSDFLRRVRRDDRLRRLPLVLHVRGQNETKREASTDCIRLLQESGVPREHPVYRHCFVGGWQEARDWLLAFPNVVFGLSPLSKSIFAHDECKVVFNSLQLDHIVIETDCPMLKIDASDVAPVTPWSSYCLFKWLAALRGLSLAETLEAVCSTVCSFYRLDRPSHNEL